MELLLIGKDSPHRRLIINKILDAGYNLSTCIFPKSNIQPRFDTSSPWASFEKTDLLNFYLKETRGDLDRLQNLISPDSLKIDNPEVNIAIENADFVIVSGADWIKGKVLDAIVDKSLNVHMGIAEEYRGLDSNLWAWYHRDYRNIGVSLHKLDHTLDTGHLFRAENLDIMQNTKVWELRYYESILASKLIIETLSEIKINRSVLKNQKKIGRYYSFMPYVLKKSLSLNPILGDF